MRPSWPTLPMPLHAELRWAAGTSVAFAEQLRDFVHMSAKFSGQLLASAYNEATSTLAQIEERAGKSLWCIKASVLSEKYVA